jgi:radical SAM protein with 4Fe4S-binding SPASM domain
MIKSDVFCAAPFKSILIDKIGDLLPCCEFMPNESAVPTGHISNLSQWWNHDLKTVRQQFAQGKKDSGCLHCDKKEKIFKQQTGQRILQNLGAHHSLEYYVNQPNTSIEYATVRFGNYCNLKCIMCGEYASSSIATEYKKHKLHYNQIGVFMDESPTVRWWEHKQSLDNLDLIISTVKNWAFSGGEPLIVPELEQILEKIHQDSTLYFSTNLTKLTNNVITKLAKFKEVTMSVSCEGTHAHNDYIRFGSSWNVIDSNIQKLKKIGNVKITVNHTLQHTSVFALPALTSWCDDNNVTLLYGIVYDNSYPSPGALTVNSAHPHDVAKFREWLAHHNNAQLQAWIDQYSYDNNLNAKFFDYVNMLDSIRGCDFYKTFSPTLN